MDRGKILPHCINQQKESQQRVSAVQLNEKLRLANIRNLISELINEVEEIIEAHDGLEVHFEHPTADNWLEKIRQCLGGDDEEIVTLRPTGIVDTEDSTSNFTMFKYLKTLDCDDSDAATHRRHEQQLMMLMMMMIL